MSQNEHQSRGNSSLFGFYQNILVGGGVTGCIILLIVAMALVIGFWLDAKFESANHIFTIGSILLSVPVTFVAILWVVRLLTSRKKNAVDEAPQKQTPQEDADLGKNS